MAHKTNKQKIAILILMATGFFLIWFFKFRQAPSPLVPTPPKSASSPQNRLTEKKIPDLHSMVLIPAGEFILGTDPDQEEELPPAFGMTDSGYQNETPRQRFYLQAFYIDRYEITFGEYRRFMQQTNHPLPKAWVDLDLGKWLSYPAQGVTWEEAGDYLEWAGKRLPTEAEWEKAARGPNGLIYVFGNNFDAKKARTDLKDTIPVTETSFDKSYYGVHGMSGNLSEWCADSFGPHPESNYHDPGYDRKFKVYKGGSWVERGHYNFSFFFRCARRGFGSPNKAYGDVGFRGAYSPK